MYAKIIDEAVAAYPYSANDLKADYPNVSFPVDLTDEMLAEFNAAIVEVSNAPQIDHTKNVAEGIPAFNGKSWVQTWLVSNASEEEIAERVDAQWGVIREQRNYLLSSCDWTQLPDAPVDAAAWAAYRQELRDITAQTDPFAIVWPTVPQS